RHSPSPRSTRLLGMGQQRVVKRFALRCGCRFGQDSRALQKRRIYLAKGACNSAASNGALYEVASISPALLRNSVWIAALNRFSDTVLSSAMDRPILLHHLGVSRCANALAHR